MEIAQYPAPEQMAAFLEKPDDGPIVMVNLLRFKEAATAPDEGISGEEAYQKRYVVPMLEFIRARGARVLWSGRVSDQVMGKGGEQFHWIGLVEYPSRQAFFEIATHPHVREIGLHRAAGLEGQWLIAAKTDG
jgi:hypothetical protein